MRWSSPVLLTEPVPKVAVPAGSTGTGAGALMEGLMELRASLLPLPPLNIRPMLEHPAVVTTSAILSANANFAFIVRS